MKKTLWVRDDRTTLKNERCEAFYNYSDRMITTELHVHDFYEVLIFVRGQARFQVEGNLYPLQSGDILLTPPAKIHQVQLLDTRIPYERFVLWIHPDFMQKASAFLETLDLTDCFARAVDKQVYRLHPDPGQLREIRTCLNRLIELDEESSGQKAFCDLLLAQVLVILNQLALSQTGEDADCFFNALVNDVIAYINTHLSEDLSLESLAAKFFVSKFYLTRPFKEYTSLPLHKFILSRRLQTARRLIEQGTSCLQASLDCGFVNYSHFSKAFSTTYGLPPSRWNEAAKAIQQPTEAD